MNRPRYLTYALSTLLKVVLVSLLSFEGFTQRVDLALHQLPAALDTTTGELTYIQVIDVPNTPASVLFDRARSWCMDTFRSSKSVIDYEDKASGVIAAKPLVYTKSRNGSTAQRVVIDIRCKDGKYRCEVHPYEFTTTTLATPVITPFRDFNLRIIEQIRQKGRVAGWQFAHLQAMDAQFKAFLTSIEAAMKQPGKSEF
ncbi:DUF4468 domain-containing protein [Fibrella aestuarina]|uniref:DUF4468 domain-containing protein n=1 Tax=Fibrella aestuarina TaxID=651143 RepID=UPI00059DA2C6|nr:DUF4468 domain-containing protein [Fibrella aestuarina]